METQCVENEIQIFRMNPSDEPIQKMYNRTIKI